MKREKPILMCSDMVRAILEGRKNQTRRLNGLDVFNYNPCSWTNPKICKVTKGLPSPLLNRLGVMMTATPDRWIDKDKPFSQFTPCPYAVDRLWVKETFAVRKYISSNNNDHEEIIYRQQLPLALNGDGQPLKWKPSIFMPRKYSRINLTVKNIRVERVQNITEEDAKAEGCIYPADPKSIYGNGYKANYQHLWESINGENSWNQNPYVWIIEFERETA